MAVHFLTFGSISNLNNYIDLIKIKTANYVYEKYLNIDKKIEANKIELSQIGSELSEQIVIETSSSPMKKYE